MGARARTGHHALRDVRRQVDGLFRPRDECLDNCPDNGYRRGARSHGGVRPVWARFRGWAMVAERIDYGLRPDELRRDLSLSRERMARLVDVSAKTVERWERQQALPARAHGRVRTQLAQIQAVRDLGLCVYTPEGFRQFLRTPLPAFGGRTPLQMIEQGHTDDVVAALASDYEGLGY